MSVISPAELKIRYEPLVKDLEFIAESRGIIARIIDGSDARLLVVVDGTTLVDAAALAELQILCKELFIVMRVNLDSAITDLDGARHLLLNIIKSRVPVACKFTDITLSMYLADLVCIAEVVGHDDLASGLDMPVGLRSVGSIQMAGLAHNYLGIDMYGKIARVNTGGATAHLICNGDSDAIAHGALLATAGSYGLVVDCNGPGGPLLTAIYAKRLHLAGHHQLSGLLLNMRVDTCCVLLKLLNSTNCEEINSLGEIRKLMRLYDAEIFKRLSADSFYNTQFAAAFILTDYMFEKNKFVAQNCSDSLLQMAVACRLALSEKVAEIKYRAAPFNFMHKGNDLLKLVTDREIEKSNLRLFPHQTYLKIMDASKEIQVQYLERLTASVKIGYLFGRGTFSAEAMSTYFRGIHVSYSSFGALKVALESKAVDYICIPTYNSLIGEIISPESYWEVMGTVDHRIDLCLYSNTDIDVRPGEKFTTDVLYLEPHVQKEAENYLDVHFGKHTEIILVDTSKTGCIRCIKDIDVRPAMTISSKNNKSNFLHMVAEDIVKHNITTFSLISM